MKSGMNTTNFHVVGYSLHGIVFIVTDVICQKEKKNKFSINILLCTLFL